MMDIQSWWPGGNPWLTRDRPISLFSTQARTEIQSPSKNFDWQYSFATTNHLQHQLTTIILCKEQILEICFSFIISTPGSVFWALWGGEVRIEEGLIRLRILWYPPPSHCSSSTIPRESGSLENPPLPSLGSLYPELTNEFLTLGLLLRWLLKIITLNRDLSGTLFRTDTLAKKVQHKIICLHKNLLLKNCIWMIYHFIWLYCNWVDTSIWYSSYKSGIQKLLQAITCEGWVD